MSSKYFDKNKVSMMQKLSILVLIKEVNLNVLRENDFEYQEYCSPYAF